MIRPPALRKGDVVALVAPSGPLAAASELDRACDVVRALGFEPRVAANAGLRDGYLAGSDERRAADFNAAARDPKIRGIFAVRGGYGAMRILDAVDYSALRADPKVVLGFSDVTALLNAVTQRAGIVTFHGPVAALSAFTPFVIEALYRAVSSAEPIGTLQMPDTVAIAPGRASGRLCGGNLSLLTALSGTPYAVDFNNALLFFEDVDEAPYRIDRMLTQLRLSGTIQRAAAILIGQCRGCHVDAEHVYAEMPLARTLHGRLHDLAVPVLSGASIGHIEEQWTIPIGVPATLDADARTLTINQAAVAK
ncbi:MAG: LD-carboxypeptidase [Candidatus Eremiobacteraeota bacterium]|nr:LD-carboxypeptidase [Candidatus Eremiobacteraeota bacterium]